MKREPHQSDEDSSEEERKKALKTNRICTYPKDFTWNELLKLLAEHGYLPRKNGSTGGSRRRFVHATKPPIILHEPHPTAILKEYQLKLVIEKLGIC